MNVKATLKNLHKKFPMMNLDELFDILDCYVEDGTWRYPNNITNDAIKIWYGNNTGIKLHDGNIGTTSTISSSQFKSSN